jgi:hypothetical protein
MLRETLAKKATISLMALLATSLALPAWGVELTPAEKHMRRAENIYQHRLAYSPGTLQPEPAEGAWAPTRPGQMNITGVMPPGTVFNRFAFVDVPIAMPETEDVHQAADARMTPIGAIPARARLMSMADRESVVKRLEVKLAAYATEENGTDSAASHREGWAPDRKDGRTAPAYLKRWMYYPPVRAQEMPEGTGQPMWSWAFTIDRDRAGDAYTSGLNPEPVPHT